MKVDFINRFAVNLAFRLRYAFINGKGVGFNLRRRVQILNYVRYSMQGAVPVVMTVMLPVFMRVLLTLFRAVYLNGNMSAENAAFFTFFFYVFNSGNAEGVELFNISVRVGDEFELSGCEHFARRAH